MWRRLILSKFPDSMSEKVLCKEEEQGRNFTAHEIVDILEGAVAMKEIISLTSEAFQDRFSTDQLCQSRPKQYQEKHLRPNREGSRKFMELRNKQRMSCICGSYDHGVTQCPVFPTSEARRNEAEKRRLCWKCFNSNHRSSDCTVLRACPKCSKDHHSALCLADASMSNSGRESSSSLPRSINNDSYALSSRILQNAEIAKLVSDVRPKNEEEQCVLMTASASAFNEETMQFEPVIVFFDTGAQKSFISCKKSKDLGLPIHGSTNFKVSGFGGKTEKFTCNEVTLTLKDGASGKLIKGVSLHTKSPLTSSMNTAKLCPADRRFIKKRMIKIAQPSLEETTITPDILLGQDLIDEFLLRDQTCTVLPSGLVLTPTVFGYAISGRTSYRRQTGGTSGHSVKNMIVIATPIMACEMKDSELENQSKIRCQARCRADSDESHCPEPNAVLPRGRPNETCDAQAKEERRRLPSRVHKEASVQLSANLIGGHPTKPRRRWKMKDHKKRNHNDAQRVFPSRCRYAANNMLENNGTALRTAHLRSPQTQRRLHWRQQCKQEWSRSTRCSDLNRDPSEAKHDNRRHGK
ncbi:Tas retrotransposon peptidase A16 [Oesophagostomum dentatum]|uniref:Tas retrotransposon peptidase A16 n=1 Tax=Oesophagostomum dentatum TaxID=61180 RepID=A0A0B1TKN7_OESDE|nr:Tas retrotransposon peptidase A16 [Oesophagostomum dentatum]